MNYNFRKILIAADMTSLLMIIYKLFHVKKNHNNNKYEQDYTSIVYPLKC